MSRAAQIQLVLRVLLTGLALIFSLRTSVAQSAFQQQPLFEFLKQNNWVPLPIPESKVQPGSIIKVTEQNNVVNLRWLGDIRTCGITDKQLRLVRGKYPSIGIGENFSVGASFAAALLNIFRFNANANEVSGAVLKIEDSGGDAIDLVALSLWMSKQGKNFQKVCGTFLAQKDVYIVSEAFRVSKGSYELVDKKGAKVEVTASASGRSISGQLQASLGQTGEMEVKGDFYFGVRRVKQLSPDTIETLGDPQRAPEADDLILKAQ